MKLLLGWTIFLLSLLSLVITFLSEVHFFPNQVTVLSSFLIIIGLVLTYISFYKGNKRYFRKKVTILFNVFLVVCICGLVNYLGYKNSKRFDLTKDQKNSISEYSRKIASNFKSSLSITIVSPQSQWPQYFEFLSLYKNSLNLKVIALDPDKDFIKVSNLNLSKQPAFIFEYEQKRKILYSGLSEQTMTIALKKFSSTSSEKICWLQGHGELNPLNSSKDGANLIYKRLQDGGYKVSFVKSVDTTCAITLILGPTIGFTDSELSKIKASKTILAIDPSLKSNKLNRIRHIFEDDGIKIRNDVIVDAELSKDTGDATVIELVDNIHKDFNKSLNSKYTLSFTSSLELGGSATPIFKSSNYPKSWSVKNFDTNSDNIHFQENSDVKGPNIIAATAKRMGKPQAVVFGSSKFLKNSEVLKTQNYSLLLNSIDWILGMKKLSFDRPERISEVLSVNSNQLRKTLFVILLLIPLLFLILSFYFYRRRL